MKQPTDLKQRFEEILLQLFGPRNALPPTISVDDIHKAMQVAYSLDRVLAEEWIAITSTGKELIEAEYRRQIEVEGYTPDHDDTHINGELEQAGNCYAEYAGDNDYTDQITPLYWPFEYEAWKPKNQIRDYIRSGAFYIAEMKRLERKGGQNGQAYTRLRKGIYHAGKLIDELLKMEQYASQRVSLATGKLNTIKQILESDLDEFMILQNIREILYPPISEKGE